MLFSAFCSCILYVMLRYELQRTRKKEVTKRKQKEIQQKQRSQQGKAGFFSSLEFKCVLLADVYVCISVCVHSSVRHPSHSASPLPRCIIRANTSDYM